MHFALSNAAVTNYSVRIATMPPLKLSEMQFSGLSDRKY